jgi:cell division septation protein DedD
MVKIRRIPKEEAQQTRRPKEPGVRRQRMNQFDEYARALAESPGEAVVYEDIEENPQKFVLSLRGAFKRAGMDVVVRKMRGRNEVRAWMADRAAEQPTGRGRGGRRRGA